MLARSQRSTFPVALVTVCILAAAFVGCGLLVDVDGLAGGAGATSDAGTADATGDGAVREDAGISGVDAAATLDAGDAGPAFCQKNDLFCDTFDEGRFDARWTTVPVGAELVSGRASSPPYAAKLAPTGNTNLFLRLTLTQPTGAAFSGTLDVQFDWSTSQVGVLLGQFNFARAGSTGNLQLFANENDVTMGINLGGSGSLSAKRQGTAFERVVVSATLSPDGQARALGLNDTPLAPNRIPWVIFEPSTLTLEFGFVAPPGKTDAVVYLDNVRVALRAP